MNGAAFLMLVQTLALFFMVRWVARGAPVLRLDWASRLLMAGSLVLSQFLLGRWDWIPYALRYLWPAALLFAAWRSFPGNQQPPPEGEEAPPVKFGWPALLGRVHLACVLLAPVPNALQGRSFPEPSLALAFPLKNGLYYVGHGGSHPVVNYHNVSPSQKYALDISKLNAVGVRAWGLQPSRLAAYAIYGDPLYSPCEGVVRSVVDGLPDHAPPAGDTNNPAGNHVEIQTGEHRVFLAHMEKGSIAVKPGQRVQAGDLLGRVGNSGNTSEPHLHIHAVRGGQSLFDGDGVPLTFNGRFLVRGDLVSSNP